MYMENLHSLSEITQNIKHKTSITCRQYDMYLEIFFPKYEACRVVEGWQFEILFLTGVTLQKKNWAAKT